MWVAKLGRIINKIRKMCIRRNLFQIFQNFIKKEIIQKKSASRDPHIVYNVSYVFYCIVPTVVNYHAM